MYCKKNRLKYGKKKFPKTFGNAIKNFASMKNFIVLKAKKAALK